MGYSTNFEGTLKFTDTITIPMMAIVKTFLGEDCRDHVEWGRTDLSYINLELSNDLTGLCWNGSEKTYDLVEKVNLIITEVQKVYPTFGLTGELKAQGEDYDDRWLLVIENGIAVKKDIVGICNKIRCPHCGENIIIEQ